MDSDKRLVNDNTEMIKKRFIWLVRPQVYIKGHPTWNTGFLFEQKWRNEWMIIRRLPVFQGVAVVSVGVVLCSWIKCQDSIWLELKLNLPVGYMVGILLVTVLSLLSDAVYSPSNWNKDKINIHLFCFPQRGLNWSNCWSVVCYMF